VVLGGRISTEEKEKEVESSSLPPLPLQSQATCSHASTTQISTKPSRPSPRPPNSKPSSLISSVMLAFQVAANLSIPTFYFYTSSGSSLAAFLYLPTLHKSLDKSLKGLDDHMLVDILGLSPFRPCLGLARPTPWVLPNPSMGVLIFFFVG
jgi:hypothetical protein